MSFGKMNGLALIKRHYKEKDSDGFKNDTDFVLASIHCYREGRHGSKRWVNLSSFTDATDLLNRAKETISKNVYNSMYIELNAIDLHNLNVDINAIRLANRVRCISKPHGIDEWLFVKSMTIDINDASKTTISLAPYIDGVSPENYTLTGNSNKDSNKIKINDNKLNEDTPSYNDLNSEIDKLKDWTDNNYTPRSEMSDYAKNTDVDDKINDVKTWTADNYASKTDLSEYAKIADVNAAFNELATAIEGV